MTSPETIISAHPVDGAARERILRNLGEIERVHQVKILLACESGSRGWGFASQDSDYDVRFVYVHRLPWYLKIDAGRDVIEKPISDELDISGWELRKTLGLLYQSNPVLLEWLQSPIVYRKTDPWAQRLHDLALDYFSPARAYHHYVSMAKKTHHAYLQGNVVRYKKYLYALRPLLVARWVRQRHGMPPMRFAELASRMLMAETEQAVTDEINRLLIRKMQTNETTEGPRWPVIHGWIERELAEAQAHRPATASLKGRRALDDFLCQAVSR